MSSGIKSYTPETRSVALSVVELQASWYAIHTRPRHEKQVESRLGDGGISTFLPVVKEVHRWSDRRKVVEMPLFSCYLFVHIILSAKAQETVLRTDGVIGFVGTHRQATAIPEVEIESVQQLLSRNLPVSPYPFLSVGQRVRIRGGALDGIDGVITTGSGDRKLVISIELIQRSVAVTLEGYDIEAIKTQNNLENAHHYYGRS